MSDSCNGGTPRDETFATLQDWAVRVQQQMVRISQLMGRVWAAEAEGEPETDETLAAIYNACLSTSDSALWLAAMRKPWDADVLIRSVYEGTTKLVFICHPDPGERQRRVREYADELPEISSIRDHTRLEELLRLLFAPESPQWRPLREMLLPTGEVERLRVAYPRARRQELERRWSFAAMTAALSTSGLPGSDGFAILMHGYGMSSHIAHVDWTGSNMIWERSRRSQERIDAIDLAHGARIMSDVLTASILRVSAAYRYKGFPLEAILEAEAANAPLRDAFHAADERWRNIEYVREANPSDDRAEC